METHLFWVKRSKAKVTSHKKQCRRGFLHSCECWLLVVVLTFMIARDISQSFQHSVMEGREHARNTSRSTSSATLTHDKNTVRIDCVHIFFTCNFSLYLSVVRKRVGQAGTNKNLLRLTPTTVS